MSILSSLLKVHQLSRVSFFSSKVHLWPCLSFPAAFLIAVSLSFALSMRVLVPLIFCIFLAPVVFDRCTVPYFKRFFLIHCSLLQHWPHEQLGILAFFHFSFLCLYALFSSSTLASWAARDSCFFPPFLSLSLLFQAF